VIVADSNIEEGAEFFIFSGTSSGTPQWAALTAITDQLAGRRLGNINPALYAIAQGSRASRALHDITTGNNNFGPVTGYPAGTGWDAVTGWGSPNAGKLAALLASSTAETGDQSSRVTAQRLRPTHTRGIHRARPRR
jgi:subtilase family serine protease